MPATGETGGARIVLVEDDARIRDELERAFRAASYDVASATRLAEARLLRIDDDDVLVLDLGLPDGDGLDLCRALRADGRAASILILTARDRPAERVAGLDAGADDYLTKPFHTDELLARVRSLLRRARRVDTAGRIEHGELWLETASRTAGRGDTPLELTPREFDLLAYLLRYPGRTFTRDRLLDAVWGRSYDGDVRTVDLHVRRLRTHVEDDPGNPRRLLTVWGVGYRLEDVL